MLNEVWISKDTLSLFCKNNRSVNFCFYFLLLIFNTNATLLSLTYMYQEQNPSPWSLTSRWSERETITKGSPEWKDKNPHHPSSRFIWFTIYSDTHTRTCTHVYTGSYRTTFPLETTNHRNSSEFTMSTLIYLLKYKNIYWSQREWI